MGNWRVHTLDKVITQARANGFNDPDFDGWEKLEGNDRIAVINQILHHNGVGQIVFRKSFARAFFGDKPIQVQQGSTIYYDPLYPGWQSHLQQMVIADDWLQYLRDYMNKNVKEEPRLEL